MSDIVYLIIGIVICISIAYEGVKQIVTGKFSGKQEPYEKYTPESVTRAAKVSGIFFVLAGVLWLIYDLCKANLIPFQPAYIFLIGAGIIIVLSLVLANVIMKKKGDNYVAPANSKDDDNENFVDKD